MIGIILRYFYRRTIMSDLRDYILELLRDWGISDSLLTILYYTLLAGAVLLICVILELLARWVILGIFFHITKKSKRKIFAFLKKHKLFQRVIHLISPFVISLFASYFDNAESWISHIITIYVIILLVMILDAALGVIDDVYRTHEVSKTRPIKGFLQIFEIIIVIVFGTVIVASWIGESPLVLLSGIGAFTAVLSIVFKDTLLGFVAGLQLTTDDMIRIGDWIEMPKFSVNGTISDISLISVKVDNFDNTTTSVPAYALVSDSFKNWRGMIQSGSRRIKRAIYIDMTSITFCSQEMLDSFVRIEYLSKYINEKTKEFEKIKSRQSSSATTESSRNQLTNIGVFRIYLEKYLAHNPKIREDMTILVRQLPAESRGLPLEVCAFAAETEWVSFENIQSDIFDHVYAIAPAFGLRLFQEPTGHDMRKE